MEGAGYAFAIVNEGKLVHKQSGPSVVDGTVAEYEAVAQALDFCKQKSFGQNGIPIWLSSGDNRWMRPLIVHNDVRVASSALNLQSPEGQPAEHYVHILNNIRCMGFSLRFLRAVGHASPWVDLVQQMATSAARETIKTFTTCRGAVCRAIQVKEPDHRLSA